MSRRRVILEMGMGSDLHGGDYTRAAVRAVKDALQHSSLLFIRSLHVDAATLKVDVTIGVQKPDAVDADVVAAALPVGRIKVRVVKGGLDVTCEDDDVPTVIASAAVEVWLKTA